MKREIKFRAFDDGKMIYEKNFASLAKFWSNVRDDSFIMQFTGMRDKNGTDIYEGDLVKFEENNKFHEVGVHGNSFVLFQEGKVCVYNWSGEHIEVLGNIHEKN